MIKIKNSLLQSTLIILILIHSEFTLADYKDDIGYSRLAAELGAGLPDGAGITVTHAEAATSYVDHDSNPSTAELPVYLPDGNDSRLTGKTINDITGFASGEYSGHATGVGASFYGSSDMAPGISTINAYWADYWLQPNFLNYGGSKPLSTSDRIANHSWVANITDTAVASNILRRVDWVIETDEFLQFVGTRNSISTNYNLFGAAHNVLAVGKTDGIHSTGSPTVDADYPAGRTRTEIVAPFTYTSSSVPRISATAALLIETGHSNLTLSTDPVQTSTTNRNGDRIYNAERSEVIKAALLAGADRYTLNTSTTANITDYRVDSANQSSNGLDARFGAGQINVYNSYHIIAAGEQNSSEDGGTGSTGIGISGFDYDPAFGGDSSNNTASYYFTTGPDPEILSASLVWHIDIYEGSRPNSFDGAATFYDLDLRLYDVTSGQQLVFESISTIDNSENIWTALSANRNYLLQVTPKAGQNAFSWDYALAWHMDLDTDGDVIADHQDNCPNDTNADQADMDNDGTGDVCDSDIDGDGSPNTTDAFPYDPTETTDTDNDGIGNNADTDDDNDGLSDIDEASLGTNPLLVDTDGDTYSDSEEVTAGTNPLDQNSYPVTADGDLNNDGVVNIVDILFGQQVLMGSRTLTADILDHGDVAPLVNGTPSPNGVFDIGDLVVIKRKAIGDVNF
ncbi:MAG: thrombospondin type 3 repeat-containing protein [Gammaproteobacteria bacterium]|nr:thrombospondin type 3 repeat-containing protein [Gammaproteobacteria bacterium]